MQSAIKPTSWKWLLGWETIHGWNSLGVFVRSVSEAEAEDSGGPIPVGMCVWNCVNMNQDGAKTHKNAGKRIWDAEVWYESYTSLCKTESEMILKKQ